MATQTATTAAAATEKPEFTAEETMVCLLDAMMNGGEWPANRYHFWNAVSPEAFVKREERLSVVCVHAKSSLPVSKNEEHNHK